MDIAVLKDKLNRADQAHVLRFYHRLPEAGKQKLTAQLEALDLDDIAELAETQVRHKAHLPLPKRIEPVKPYPRVPGPDQRDV